MSNADAGRTLLDKVWDDHVVAQPADDAPTLLYIDLHLVQEVSSPQAFELLRTTGRKVRCPNRTLATIDHSTPTIASELYGDFAEAQTPSAQQVRQLQVNCAEQGIELYGTNSQRRGIVHVIGPELGASLPGSTIVCGDSHTSTHGALGALAFGIGTSEVAHVLATQCLVQQKPKTMAINLDGQLQPGVSAKDLILATIGQIGVSGGNDHVIEYRGTTLAHLSMEQRMTVCNMSVEAGARAGMMAPDDVTYDYLFGRPLAPQGKAWDQALAYWRLLPSDADAFFDQQASVAVDQLAPQISFGTNPGMVIPIDGVIPATLAAGGLARALDYMGFSPGQTLLGQAVNVAFIGSCTNGRIEDLREAADVLRGRRVHPQVRMLVVPGSQKVKQQAEAEGLHRVFLDAGASWRESGCSMCIGMNGDEVGSGEYAVSTSNRNFEGRQGAGARTLLASPLTVAASAVAGAIADPRQFMKA